MSKNVAVFVDVANIFYAAKAAGVDIDYVTLLKASSAGRDLVRAYAYTGLDPDNENQRNFHDFLRRHGYKVVSKDIRKYGDGKVKANLDIELVVDMMKTARNLDIAIVVSGDGDFAPAIRAVQEMGVRVEVVSFRGNTSSDLIEVADIFTDITQIAKVEKGSSRSGRRVATDDEDLSMTEVPDKLTEGSGDGRRRGRGGRSRTSEAPATRTPRVAASGRSAAGRAAASAAADAEQPSNGEAGLIVLPGEKLSRAVRPAAASRSAASTGEDEDFHELGPEDDLETGGVAGAGAAAGLGAEADEGAEGDDLRPEGEGIGEDGQRRRRRRRGGRGRGRGRGREGAEPLAGSAAGAADYREDSDDGEDVSDITAPAAAPRRPSFSFGSVWDSQLGVPPANAGRTLSGPTPAAGLSDEEDLDEPEIPEYLLAERRQRDANRGGRGGRGGVRGGRGGAYAAAMDRERYGAGRGATPSRFAEPAPRRDFREPRDNRGGGQPNRQGGSGAPRFDRPDRSEPRNVNGDPWSEVPPEIEAMLRAQLASGGGRAARPAPPAARETSSPSTLAERGPGGVGTTEATPASQPASASSAPSRAGRSARSGGSRSAADAPVSESSMATDAEATVEAGAARPRARRASAGTASRARASSPRSSAGGADAESASSGDAAASPPAKPTRRRAASKASAAEAPGADAATASGDAAQASAAPQRRTVRKAADPSA